MELEQPTVNHLLTIGTNALAVGIVTEVIKRAAAFSQATADRFAPLISVSLGIGLAGGAALISGTFVPDALLVGLFGGATASGLYSLKNVK